MDTVFPTLGFLPSSRFTADEQAWREHAACLGRGVEVNFFSETVLTQARAKALCSQCPVRADCLEYGLYEPAGIWGGMGVRERQRERRRRAVG